MVANDYGFIEVLTGNPHWEAAINALSSYFSNKYFYRYCAMATLFSSIPPGEWRIISSTESLSLADLENNSLGPEAYIATLCPYFEFLCVDGGENIFQKSGCPHFCNYIINISIHILYQRLARHMQNLPHGFYSYIFMPFIELISLFQLEKNCHLLQVSLYSWSVYAFISLLVLSFWPQRNVWPSAHF